MGLLFSRETEVVPEDRKEKGKRETTRLKTQLRFKEEKFGERFDSKSLDLPSCRAVGVGRGGAGQCRLTSVPLSFKVNLDL